MKPKGWHRTRENVSEYFEMADTKKTLVFRCPIVRDLSTFGKTDFTTEENFKKRKHQVTKTWNNKTQKLQVQCKYIAAVA